jgi:hypothetical protein
MGTRTDPQEAFYAKEHVKSNDIFSTDCTLETTLCTWICVMNSSKFPPFLDNPVLFPTPFNLLAACFMLVYS